MPSLLFLLHPINENVFESFDPNHRAWLAPFLPMWIEIRWVVDLRAFGIAMDVGEHCQNTGCMIPENLASRFAHRD
jgi:hypothetical protein